MWAPHDLVEQVKWAQRSSPAWKDQWHRFCDQAMGGVRDPSKHEAASLRQFLSMIGALPNPGAAMAPAQMGAGPLGPVAGVLQPMGGMQPHMGGMPQVRPQMPQAMGVYPQAAPGGFPAGAWPMDGAAVYQAHMAHQLACGTTGMGLSMPYPSVPQPLVPPLGYPPHGMVPTAATMTAPLQAVVPTGQPGAGAGAGAGADSGDAVHARLVQQVKQLQRYSDKQQAAWHLLCDVERGGVRDPAMHDSQLLQRFLQSQGVLAAGGAPPAQDGAGSFVSGSLDLPMDELVAQVKRAQRAGWKDAWSAHCEQEAGGMRDPARHTVGSLKRFLENRSRLPPGSGAEASVPSAAPSRPPAAQTASGKVNNVQLVETVKAAQRASPEQKDLWRKHCDAHGSGIYDPLRHDDGFLQAFLDEYGITEEPGASAGRGPRAGPPRPSPGVEPLVQRVKQAQRASEELLKAWHHMCDVEGEGIRDPVRHEAAFLQRFLDGAPQAPGAG